MVFSCFNLVGGIREIEETKVSKRRGLRKYLYRKENPPIQNGQKHTHNQKEGEEEEEEEENEDVEEEVETDE